MIYRFLILSDEVDDFVREISIDSEATFFDLHEAILEAVDYNKDQMTSFFLCNDDWEKKEEITLVEMDAGSEYDNLVMDETVLNEYLSDEGQKMLYIFDYIFDRVFFIELKEIVPGKNLDDPIVTLSEGKAPDQVKMQEDVTAFIKATDVDASFYGDEDFDIEELDEEGFGDVNFDDDSIFVEEPKY